MWTCPKCERNFKTTNQSHTCSNVDMGELFLGKPDNLVLAFDALLMEVSKWTPCSAGTAKNSIVFASKKAWLIVKPMTKELDLKFYNDEPLDSYRLKKVSASFGKYAHHIRVKSEVELDQELYAILRIGFNHSLK